MLSLIVYLKVKDTKFIVIRKPKVLKDVMFYDSNYAIEKYTRNSVSGIVATLGGTLIACFSKTKRTVMLSRTDA